MLESKYNNEIKFEKDQIFDTEKHLQIAWWIVSVLYAVVALTCYIIVGVEDYQPRIDILNAIGASISKLQGYYALLFFVLLISVALFIYLMFIFKNYLQIKLGYCNDIKSIRESFMISPKTKDIKKIKDDDPDKENAAEKVKQLNEMRKNCDWVETGEPIFNVSDVEAEIKDENNYNEIEAIVSISQPGKVYYLWSKKYLAYIVGVVTDEEGRKRVNYSKNSSHCKAFISEIDALNYLNEKLYVESNKSVKI